MTIKIERFELAGPVGRLEAQIERPHGETFAHCALVLHPHPARGGMMHNKVAYRAAHAALDAGMPALRFNFRGVGMSEGEYSGGMGERDDAKAALDWLAARFQGAAICVLGFSFGAWVGLEVGARDARVAALVGLGLPTNHFQFDFLKGITKPKLIVQATRDQFGARSAVQAVYDSLAEPKQIYWVEGVDHFFTGKLDEVQEVVAQFLRSR